MGIGRGNKGPDPWQRSLKVAGIVFFTAAGISWVSQEAMSGLPVLVAFPLLLFMVGVGVMFDMVGTAVAAAEEPPLHARAAKKRLGARHALWLVRNAAAVANFSSDIVSDTVGTVSGAAAATVALQVARWLGGGGAGPVTWQDVAATVAVGLVASLTIGGKALGKEIALRRANDVVWVTGLILAWLEQRLRIRLVPNSREQRR